MSQIDQKDPPGSRRSQCGGRGFRGGAAYRRPLGSAGRHGQPHHTTGSHHPRAVDERVHLATGSGPCSASHASRPDTQASTAQTGTGAASKAEARAAQADPGTHAACDQRSGTRAQCARWCTGADAARATCTARSSTCTPKPGARAASTSGCATHRAALQQCCLPEQPQACLPVGQPAPG